MEYQEIEKELTPQPSTFKTGLTYGTLGGLSVVSLSLIGSLITNNPKDTISIVLQFISYGLILLWILFAIKQYKFNLIQSEIPFGRGVAIGTWVSLFLSIILAVYTYFYFNANPELIEKIKEMSAQSIEENPGMKDADKENAIEMMGGFMNPTVLAIGSMVNYFIVAFICSLIGSGIQKFIFPYKENQN